MTLVHPLLFSTHFGVQPKHLSDAGLLDPILNSDTKLFIDPLLVPQSENPILRTSGNPALIAGLTTVIELIAMSERENDAAWKAAYRALNLDERSETGLGYGGASTRGASRPPVLRNSILRTAKEIVTLGEKNPAMIPLMALFEEGVGPDSLSDLTTNLLLPALCEITSAFAIATGIPTAKASERYGSLMLPQNPFRAEPVILVPRDILRDLPLAADWSDVSRVVFEIREIRDAVNRMVGNIARATVAEKKRALRRVALSSLGALKAVIAAVEGASESYDEKADLDGFYLFRTILHSDRAAFKGLVSAPDKRDQATLRDTVTKIIQQFKELVEDNNLWELLWNGSTPRHERAAQLLFFAVSTVICSANDIDISPETNSGGGPVDFKFSTGFKGRVLVELKLSKGTVVHGYRKQLEIYKSAAKTDAGILLVVDVGGMGRKLRDIRKYKELAEMRGETTSDIVLIDAKRRVSASKR